LQQHLYAGGEVEALPALRYALQQAFRRPPQFQPTTASASPAVAADGLPPLYPPR
jgi:hypothetical protein